MIIERNDGKGALTFVKTGSALVIKSDKPCKKASFKLTLELFKILELFCYKQFSRLEFLDGDVYSKVKGISIRGCIVTINTQTPVKNLKTLTMTPAKEMLEMFRKALKTKHIKRPRLETTNYIYELEDEFGRDCWYRSDEAFLRDPRVLAIRAETGSITVQERIRDFYLKTNSRKKTLNRFKSVWRPEMIAQTIDFIEEERKPSGIINVSKKQRKNSKIDAQNKGA